MTRRHPVLVLARRCGFQDGLYGSKRALRLNSRLEREAYLFGYCLARKVQS